MKHKLIAIVGLASPLLLFGFCTIGLLTVGTISWLIFGSGSNSSITKIATVGPFFGAKVLPGQPDEAPESDIPQVVAANTNSETVNAAEQPETNEASTTVVEDVPELSHEEIVNRLGFAIPENAVNSITYNGQGAKLVIPKI